MDLVIHRELKPTPHPPMGTPAFERHMDKVRKEIFNENHWSRNCLGPDGVVDLKKMVRWFEKQFGKADPPAGDLPDVSLEGKVVSQLPSDLRDKLSSVCAPGDDEKSEKDFGIMLGLLEAGLSEGDAATTFAKSVRGADAKRRHPSFSGYLRRTLSKAVQRYQKHKGHHVEVDFSPPDPEKTGYKIHAVPLSDYTITRPEWLWRGWVPSDELVAMVGMEGDGKSTMSLNLAARITSGQNLPDGQRCPKRQVILASTEDRPDKVILPRLMAVGGDPKMVQFVKWVEDKHGNREVLNLNVHQLAIKNFIQQTGASLFIFDPLYSYIGPSKYTSINSDQDMRRMLDPLDEVCAETRCAMMFVHYYNKKSELKKLHQVSGSGLTKVCRSVLVVEPDEARVQQAKGAGDGREWRILASIKSNYSKRPTPLGFYFEEWHKDWAKAVWDGPRPDWSPTDLGKAVVNSDYRKCAKLMRELLSTEGEIWSEEVKKDMRSQGFSSGEIRLAREFLQVQITREQNGRYLWRLP